MCSCLAPSGQSEPRQQLAHHPLSDKRGDVR
jgi:hypothetical protein